MSRVVYISTDGMRPDALTPARTPNLEALIRRGSFTPSARSVMPSISLPCHMSIFHSVPPSRHGIVVNTFQPMARPVPGLIEVLSTAGKRCATFFSWEPLRDLCRPGHLAVSTLIAYDRNPEVADDLVVREALPYIAAGEHDFVFLYLATIDEVGHDAGWMSEPYLRQVERADTLIGSVLDVLPSDADIVIHSDHGGHGRTHGTDCDDDMTIPWLLAGPSAVAGLEIDVPVSLLDTAPTIGRLLGVQADARWEGRIVTEALGGSARPVVAGSREDGDAR